MNTSSDSGHIISFQGAAGAFSDLACRTVHPEMKTLPCTSFDEAFLAVQEGRAKYAMIPIDNTIAGRVADVHHLIPDSGLYITGEHFQPIEHCLLAVRGTKIDDLKDVHSHVHALPQCRDMIKELGLRPYVYADTAASAAKVAKDGRGDQAAIASELAAHIYDLDILKKGVQDNEKNTTRFVILSREPLSIKANHSHQMMTSLAFDVRNIPAALYKALGGFATNGVNMTKLESYIGEEFQAAKFYSEIVGHPDQDHVKLALEELAFFANDIKILGTYEAHSFRSV
jgi:prephenate dehydratase